MLLSGVPLLVFPSGLEQSMWAYRITSQGFGSMVNPFKPEADINDKIEAALHLTESNKKLQRFTRRYADYDSDQTVRDIANCISIGQKNYSGTNSDG